MHPLPRTSTLRPRTYRADDVAAQHAIGLRIGQELDKARGLR